jgi:hypothetical protein
MKTRKRKLDISYEAAENELDVFLDYYDIYPEEMVKEDEKDNLLSALENIIIHIRAGLISFETTKDGDVNVIQKLKNAPEGTKQTAIYESINIPNAKVQMKNAKNDDQYGKMYALMGCLSGSGAQWVKSRKGVDYKVMEALSVLFLQCTSG